MERLLERINEAVWGNGLILLLIGTGLFFTVKLRFVQLRAFTLPIRAHQRRSAQNRGLSQGKTVCMALGAAMGTGNITGAASAVMIGGAGAVFWMWVSALLGMAIVYAENCLSVKYSSGDVRGPMAYLSKGVRSPVLAYIFAFMCICAAFGMGGMVQVSSAADAVSVSSPLARPVVAVVSFVLISAVTGGGTKRIGSAASVLLPVASAAYGAACAAVLITFRENIPQAFADILSGAFSVRSAVGGISGLAVSRAVSVGIRRGIFSNEAGLGTSALLHSAAESDSPELQADWAMTEVFFDTVICCTLTALVMLCSPCRDSVGAAFSAVLGRFGAPFIATELAVFAFCTVIGQFYCAGTAFRYITGNESGRTFSLLFAICSSLGAVLTARTVWTLSDIFNGLMALPNLLGLLLLSHNVTNKSRKTGNNSTNKNHVRGTEK